MRILTQPDTDPGFFSLSDQRMKMRRGRCPLSSQLVGEQLKERRC